MLSFTGCCCLTAGSEAILPEHGLFLDRALQRSRGCPTLFAKRKGGEFCFRCLEKSQIPHPCCARMGHPQDLLRNGKDAPVKSVGRPKIAQEVSPGKWSS